MEKARCAAGKAACLAFGADIVIVWGRGRWWMRPPGRGYGIQRPRLRSNRFITGETKELLENGVLPLVEEFMAERGLELSKEKTVITHITADIRKRVKSGLPRDISISENQIRSNTV